LTLRGQPASVSRNTQNKKSGWPRCEPAANTERTDDETRYGKSRRIKISERVEDDPVRLNCQRGVVRIALLKSDDPAFKMPEW
jgi:hypothetical protein